MKNPFQLKIFFIFLFLFGLDLLTPQNVFAHILKYDGSIGAVLHVNPEDDPIAGETTGFFFEFKDKKNKFLPENCDCLIRITKDENEIYTQDLFKDNPNPGLTNASFSYIFSSIGVYGVLVEGKPKDGSFDNFTLKYDIRVARTTANSSIATSQVDWWSSHQWHVILSILIALVTFVVYILSNKKK